MFRILTYNFNEAAWATYAGPLIQEIPLVHDLNENEAISKCAI